MDPEKPASQAESVDQTRVDPKAKDARKRPGQDKGLDAALSSRTPETEPPKEKRSDDL